MGDCALGRRVADSQLWSDSLSQVYRLYQWRVPDHEFLVHPSDRRTIQILVCHPNSGSCFHMQLHGLKLLIHVSNMALGYLFAFHQICKLLTLHSFYSQVLRTQYQALYRLMAATQLIAVPSLLESLKL